MNPFHSARAVLFDLDGTLVETHIDFPYMKREMLALIQRFGIDPLPLESLDILALVEAARANLMETHREADAANLRGQAFARLEEIEVEQCRSPVLYKGASELTRRLRARGARVGIVTRNCRRVSLDLVGFAGLYFDALITRDDVPLTKPNPLHLQAALQRMGCSTLPGSEDCRPGVMIGDHWMDVKAGRSVQFTTVGVLHGRPRSVFDPESPDVIVERIGDLLPLAE